MKSFEDDSFIGGKSKKKNSPKGSNSKHATPDRHMNGNFALGDRLVSVLRLKLM